MKKNNLYLIFWSLFFLITSTLTFSQRRERPPWEDRSPKIGKKVPDVKVYNEKLEPISFSSLYKNTLMIVQWGGCT